MQVMNYFVVPNLIVSLAFCSIVLLESTVLLVFILLFASFLL